MFKNIRSFRRSLAGKNSWLLLFAVAFLLLGINVFLNRRSDFSELVANHMDMVLNKRFSILESYMEEALEQDKTRWLDLKSVPEDMVI